MFDQVPEDRIPSLAEALIRLDQEGKFHNGAELWNELETLDPIRQVQQLRKWGCDPELVPAILELRECRKRAAGKFSEPDRLLLTRRGLEQASSQNTASWKVKRLRQVVHECPQQGPFAILDLCSGVGADALALRTEFPVLAIDRDPVLATFAEHNLSIDQGHDPYPFHVWQGDVQQVLRAESDRLGDVVKVLGPSAVQWCAQHELQQHTVLWHLDPDRRSDQQRHIRLEDFSPGQDFLEALCQRFSMGMIKVAPATRIPKELLRQASWYWLGEEREAKQLVGIWGGDVGQQGAVVWDPGQKQWREEFGPAGICPQLSASRSSVPDQGVLLQFHSAAQLAGRDSWLATRLGAQPLAGDRYFWASAVSESDCLSPFAAGFQIQTVCSPRPKAIQEELRKLELGWIEIKKAAVDASLQNQLMSQLRKDRSSDPGSATIILVRTGDGKKVQAVLTRRL